MKILVAGHIAIDRIISEDFDVTSLGGPPCYVGLQARNLGLDVELTTKIGYDFPDEYLMWLLRSQLSFTKSHRSTVKPTTRFLIKLLKDGRELCLQSRCEDLELSQLDDVKCDGVVVSPICGEVSDSFLKKAFKLSSTIYMDPQGFLRRYSNDGKVSLGSFDIGLVKYAEIVKVDEEEALVISGGYTGVEAGKVLMKMKPRILILTRGREDALLFSPKGIYSTPIPSLNVADTTGAGDILAGAFMATYLKDADPVWSFCIGIAASSLSVQKIGIAKIPEQSQIWSTAEDLKEKVRKLTV